MSERMTTPQRWEELKHFFAKYPYFQVAIDALKEKGYRFLAKIQVDSTLFPYFVPRQAARVTSIFMSMPRRAIIIQFEFHEDFENQGEHWVDGETVNLGPDDPRLYRCYWKVRIHYSHCWKPHYRKFLEEFDETGLTFWDMDEVRERRWQEARLLKVLETETPFHEFGTGHYEQLSGGQQRLDPKVVAEFAHERITHLLPWLYQGFLRLDVFNFAPYNVFNNSLDWFWEQFPLNRLVEYGICRSYEGHEYRPSRW